MDKKPTSLPSTNDHRQEPDESPLTQFKETFIKAISKFTKTAAEIIEIPEDDLKIELPPEESIDDAKAWAEKQMENTKSAITSAISELDEKKEDEAAEFKKVLEFDLAGW